MDSKTETQLRQELAQAWALVDAYKQEAKRYAAKRKSIFLTSMRLQVGGPRRTEEEFNADYDASCDKHLAGYVTDHRGVWVKDEAMALTPNSELTCRSGDSREGRA